MCHLVGLEIFREAYCRNSHFLREVGSHCCSAGVHAMNSFLFEIQSLLKKYGNTGQL